MLELKPQAFVMFTLFWEKRDPSRKTELDKTWELSGDRRRPETATISPDQFMLANGGSWAPEAIDGEGSKVVFV